ASAGGTSRSVPLPPACPRSRLGHHLRKGGAMSRAQKLTVGWGLALFVGMFLFPPFAQPEGGPVRYGFLFEPPSNDGPGGPYGVYAPRLLGQWFVLAVAFTGLFFLNKGEPTPAAAAGTDKEREKQEAPPTAAQEGEGVKLLQGVLWCVIGFGLL